MRPTLIVVTGHSGSGKTTLTGELARTTGWDAVIRDGIKEDMGKDDAGEIPNDLVNDRFFDAIATRIARGCSVVADAAFQHFRWAPALEPFTGQADLRVVLCRADPDVAKDRIVMRMAAQPARRVHSDAQILEALEAGTYAFTDYDPPKLDVPTLSVDTTDGYDPAFDEIVAFVR